MNSHVTRILAIAGLGFALAGQAHAHPSNFGFVGRLAPTQQAVRYYDESRHHDRDYRNYRGWDKRGKKHRKLHRRLEKSHDHWHRHNDWRRDRYYDRDHWTLHYELGFGHFDFHHSGRDHH